jgi:5-methylcytosine-specific restriction endonuclease McrA
MKVVATYSYEEIKPILGHFHSSKFLKKKFGFKTQHLNNSKFKLLKKSNKCCYCGLTGETFQLEKNPKSNGYHILNLYGYTVDKEKTMLTFDHIIPKSLGGTKDLNNGQVLCQKCNSKKGNKIEE